jgi:hypothetical protein
VSGTLKGHGGAAIGSGLLRAEYRVQIDRILVTNVHEVPEFYIASVTGAAIGSGAWAGGFFHAEEVMLQDSELLIWSNSGSGIGIGAYTPDEGGEESEEASTSLTIANLSVSGSVITVGSEEGSGIALSRFESIDDATQRAWVSNISFEDSLVIAEGQIAIGRIDADGAHVDPCRLSFLDGATFGCQSAEGREPCALCREMDLSGEGLLFGIVNRAIGPDSPNVTRSSKTRTTTGVIFYQRPSHSDSQSDGPALHFGRMFAERKEVLRCTVRSTDNSDYVPFTFVLNTSEYQSLGLLLPKAGSYRVTYHEVGATEDVGSICDQDSDPELNDVFEVENQETFLLRAILVDFPGPPEPLSSWEIFLICLLCVVVIVICLTIFVVCRFHACRESLVDDSLDVIDDDTKEQTTEGEQQEAAEAGKAGEDEEPDTARVIGAKLRAEFHNIHSVLQFLGWICFILARLWVIIMMLIIAYIGFVCLVYFSLLILFSFIVTLFMNTLSHRTVDLSVQICMWIYIIPLAEYMFSLNVAAIEGLFSDLLANMDFVRVTRALRRPKGNENRCVFFDRWAWYIVYFVFMGVMFIISCVPDVPDLSEPVSSAFGLICLVVPIVALLRPVVTAWGVWLFDRDELQFVPQSDEPETAHDEGDSGILSLDGLETAHEEADIGLPEEPEPAPTAKRIRGVTRAWRNLAGRHTRLLVDPSGLLNDRSWGDYLRSAETAHARPQLKNPRTWIVTAVVFIWLVVVIVLDVVRMAHVVKERNTMADSVQGIVSDISESYNLGFQDPEIPSGSSDVVFLLVRIVILLIVFPLTVLSHHATLLMPGRWSHLQKNNGPVHSAKLTGLLFLLAGFGALIVGASLRALHPWFDPHEIFSTPLNNETYPMFTLADVHPVCRRWVSDWSFLQLAAIPVLVEARRDYPVFYSEFASHMEIRLLQQDEDFDFNTTALIVFDRETKRLLVAPAAIPFVDNYGIYLENQLGDYYGGVIDECIPLYGLASTFFLSNLLPAPTEALTTGILGPNRLTVQWLNNATLSVKQDLEVVTEIMAALGLAAERPVFVGHGAAGLLVKALQLQNGTDPWRVAFESAVLADSPMATISGAADNDDALPTIFNFMGDGSLFAHADDEALANVKLLVYPEASELVPLPRELVPPHAVRTFCHIQAACGVDSVIDDMCERAFPGEFQEGMCETYARPRTSGEPPADED